MRCLLDLVDKGLQTCRKPHSDTAQKLHLLNTIYLCVSWPARHHQEQNAILASGIWLAILLRRSFGKWLLMELMESRNICGCTTESISWLVAWTASLSTLLLARICLEHRSKMFWR